MLKFLFMMALFATFIFERLFAEGIMSLKKSPDSERQKSRARAVYRYSDWGLRILGIELETEFKAESNLKGLIVSNHLSYVDVMILGKTFPCLFITSVEVRNTFGLGHITKLAGCVFVERRSRNSLDVETRTIRETLASHVPVVLFPEGTSTDGLKVLPFRAALFQSAIDAEFPVHTFYLRYNNPAVAYHGDMEFVSHLLNLGRQSKIRCTLTYLGEVMPLPNTDRKWIAEKTYASVLAEHVSRT